LWDLLPGLFAGMGKDLLPYLLGRLSAGLGLLNPRFHAGKERIAFLFLVLFFIAI
jgi:hypothetical protein